MQASTNIQRTPERRAGRRELLAVSAALVMALLAGSTVAHAGAQ
jgi:hypothetical protein